jgi:hypothetical protein
MAASDFVPARRTAPAPRAIAATAAARTAPRGSGLAPVVPLPIREEVPVERVERPAGGHRSASVPALRLVPIPSRSRSRAFAIAAVVATVVLAVSGVVGASIAGPGELEVAGHVVLQPGETLWDVAVRSAPAGVDPRRQLDDLRRINGFGPGPLDAWTVVLIPVPWSGAA